LLSLQTMASQWRWSLQITKWEAIWSEIIRLVKYQLVGFSNSVVSIMVLNLFFFLWPPTTPLILVLGSSTAYAAGDLNSFWWNGRWTFAGKKSRWRQFARFAALSLLFMSINAALLWGSSGWLLGLLLPQWLMSNIPQIFMAVTGSIGYLACRLWVFR